MEIKHTTLPVPCPELLTAMNILEQSVPSPCYRLCTGEFIQREVNIQFCVVLFIGMQRVELKLFPLVILFLWYFMLAYLLFAAVSKYMWKMYGRSH